MSHHDNAALGENGIDQYFGPEPTKIMLLLCMIAFIFSESKGTDRANLESSSTLFMRDLQNLPISWWDTQNTKNKLCRPQIEFKLDHAVFLSCTTQKSLKH